MNFIDLYFQNLKPFLIVTAHSPAPVTAMNSRAGGRRQGPSNRIDENDDGLARVGEFSGSFLIIHLINRRERRATKWRNPRSTGVTPLFVGFRSGEIQRSSIRACSDRPSFRMPTTPWATILSPLITTAATAGKPCTFLSFSNSFEMFRIQTLKMQGISEKANIEK